MNLCLCFKSAKTIVLIVLTHWENKNLTENRHFLKSLIYALQGIRDAFSRELEISLPSGKAIFFGSSLYWVPEEMPDIQRIKVVRPGLELGELKKNRFEPAHALALWLKKCGKTENYPADSQEIRKYMEGQVLPGNCKGWCLITVDGYGIGWGKGDGTTIKNHYPKGLRRNS